MVGLPIVWRADAQEDLASIIGYVAARNVTAARRLKQVIEVAVLPLSQHPYLYRVGWVPGTRELVAHPNYIVIYRVTAAAIEIVNVLHARQHYP